MRHTHLFGWSTHQFWGDGSWEGRLRGGQRRPWSRAAALRAMSYRIVAVPLMTPTIVSVLPDIETDTTDGDVETGTSEHRHREFSWSFRIDPPGEKLHLAPFVVPEAGEGRRDHVGARLKLRPDPVGYREWGAGR